jgi:K+-transporting ATPase ATPase A chain
MDRNRCDSNYSGLLILLPAKSGGSMMIQHFVQLLIFFLILLLVSYPFGKYLAHIFTGKKVIGDKFFTPIEKLVYKIIHVNPESEMMWVEYTVALLLFNGLGFLFLFLILVFQHYLPMNPLHLPGLRWDLAFNTAISFVTNTNWQAFAGEVTVSPFTQMAGLVIQNFFSAATGIVVAVVLTRGLIRKQVSNLGNFWSDMTKTFLRVLLPLSIIFALVLVWQGVPQNIQSKVAFQTVEGKTQTIVMGPIASQEAIKELGTNGGGYYNANSSHPFENPTPVSNLIEIFLILFLATSLVFMFGFMVGNKKQGIVILVSMLILYFLLFAGNYFSEVSGNPNLTGFGTTIQSMEGKEVRFGLFGSVLFATTTTSTSCGAVNSMHSSFAPLSGLFLILPIMLGEVVFGGVGAGLYSILLFVFLTVFIIGLMVGRTPEYLGKKIESFEMKMTMIAILIPSSCILIGSAVAAMTKIGTGSILNPGPHGLTEILYAFSSASGNNGSAFAGLNVNTVFYNLFLGVAMLLGRFGVIIPVMAIAGSLANKKTIPCGEGTFTTTSPLFVFMLIFIILIIGALTFFPSLVLGPILEHMQMLKHISY